MSRSNRKKPDLDYLILHRTGRRVTKSRDLKMANEELRLHVINISSDIEDFYDSYQLEELIEVDELENYLSKLGDMKRNFRRIHSQLKLAEGENFSVNYSKFDTTLS